MNYLPVTMPIMVLGLLLFSGHSLAASLDQMAHKQKAPANNYIGASIGRSDTDTMCAEFSRCTDDGESWKIYSGVRLNENVVMEGGYIQFGEITAYDADNNKTTSTLSGYTTAGIATYQYNSQLELFGKGGMIWWENEATSNNGKKSHDDSSTFLGIGVNYDLGDNLGIKAEWERFDGIKRFQTEQAYSMDLISLGVTLSSL